MYLWLSNMSPITVDGPKEHYGMTYQAWQYPLRTMYYNDVIMGTMASQITSLTIVYSTVYSDADQRKHPSSASLAFVWGIHRGPVNSPHKWPVTRKMFHVILRENVANKTYEHIQYIPWNLHTILLCFILFGCYYYDYCCCYYFYTYNVTMMMTSSLTWTFPQVRQEPILHSQYHGCWCPGDARSQGISNHDIYNGKLD